MARLEVTGGDDSLSHLLLSSIADQEPGEETRYFTHPPQPAPAAPAAAVAAAAKTTTAAAKVAAKAGGAAGAAPASHATPELPMPQEHVLAQGTSAAEVQVDGPLTSTKLTAAISATLKVRPE